MSNYQYVRSKTKDLQQKARQSGLMHGLISSRFGNRLNVNSNSVVNFANCSYLGLDTDPRLIRAAHKTLSEFGINFCAARTRLSIQPLAELETGLTSLFGAEVITFPSVTTTHVNVLPLLSSGLFFSEREDSQGTVILVDRFAHASMQTLIPILREHAEVRYLPHNDTGLLWRELANAKKEGKDLIYVCDSVYSMGGTTPLEDLKKMLLEDNFFLYIDDAHGTSIFGENGEGFVLSQLHRDFPKNMFLTFSLTKGFGCNGGGVLVGDPEIADKIRSLGSTYQFSGGMDFASICAALASLEIHKSGEVRNLQHKLWKNVAYFDSLLSSSHACSRSPIRMIDIGDAVKCVEFGEHLLANGFYVPAVFFPVVPQGEAQLRICLTSSHTKEQIESLCGVIKERLDQKIIPSSTEAKT